MSSKNRESEQDLRFRTRFQALSSASFEAIFLSEKGICVDQNQTAEQMFEHMGFRVILCSGYNEQDAIQHLDGEGPVGFIQKPFTMNELKEKLGEILNGSGGGG